jgi:hypothetical protein
MSSPKGRGKKIGAWALGIAAPALLAAGIFISSSSPSAEFTRVGATTTPLDIIPNVPKDTVAHVAVPEPMYAIYMTQCAVGTPSLRNSLVELLDSTKLNAVVIDIKDYSGTIAFKPKSAELMLAWNAAKCGAGDMREFIATLHEKGIYVIGRITVFQDPFMSKVHPERAVQSKARPGEPWKDNKGLSFIAVNSQEHWRYIVELARESYEIGFDELNFDYVRWPSDGPMSDIIYPSRTSTRK